MKSANLSDEVRTEILNLMPQKYIGKAVELTDEAITRVKSTLEEVKKYAA